MELPFKIKKQSLNRNSKKDSRKSVLNQTHIVGHGKPENRFPARRISPVPVPSLKQKYVESRHANA